MNQAVRLQDDKIFTYLVLVGVAGNSLEVVGYSKQEEEREDGCRKRSSSFALGHILNVVLSRYEHSEILVRIRTYNITSFGQAK